jgi:hypothetical protein
MRSRSSVLIVSVVCVALAFPAGAQESRVTPAHKARGTKAEKSKAPVTSDSTKPGAPAPPDAPSMTETATWITERLPSLSIATYQSVLIGGVTGPSFLTSQVQSARIDSCRLLVETSLDSRGLNGGAHYASRDSVPLRLVDLSASQVKKAGGAPQPGDVFSESEHWQLLLDMRGHVDSAREVSLPSGKVRNTWRVFLPAASQDAGDRMWRSIQRAVTLCGGKRDIF